MPKSGRHFLQIPGPTNVPDRVLRALSRPTIDHRGPEFAALTREVLSGLKEVFLTSSPVIIYPGSGTGAWEAKLADARSHAIKAVCVVHNETSTGVVSRIADIRKQIDAARHPALLLVDTISSLGSIEYRHDAWGVDVTIGCSQKGLMLPPGISFNAVSEKALSASKSAKMPRAYWDWEPMLRDNKVGFFPYTPSTNILFGLRESLLMIADEGL